MGCNNCPLQYDITTLKSIASRFRTKKENWLQRIIRDIKYKIWFNRNWK